MGEDVRRPKVALFPGSFDPVTNGHLDLIHRARGMFDEVVVAVANNVSKSGLFSLEEKLEMLSGIFAETKGVRIDSFEGLVVEHARNLGACAAVTEPLTAAHGGRRADSWKAGCTEHGVRGMRCGDGAPHGGGLTGLRMSCGLEEGVGREFWQSCGRVLITTVRCRLRRSGSRRSAA